MMLEARDLPRELPLNWWRGQIPPWPDPSLFHEQLGAAQPALCLTARPQQWGLCREPLPGSWRDCGG